MDAVSFNRRLLSSAGWTALLLAGSAILAGIAWPPARREEPRPAVRGAAGRGGEAARASVAGAEEALRRNPGDVAAHHRLAIALMREQRKTENAALSRRAERTLLAARSLDPGDYQTRKLLAWVRSSLHRFEEALLLARECARMNPSDPWNYGVIGDCLTESGDYDGALAAVQRMLDLRPGPASYARAAHQRRLHGDPAGALEMYATALEATDPGDGEAHAWIRTQSGEIRFLQGDLDGAGREYAHALERVPDYPLALAGRALLLSSRGRLEESAAAFRDLLERVDRPDWRAALGDVYLAMGRRGEAEAQYRAVDRSLSQQLDDPTADAGHALAEFLADRGREPGRALALAREEAAGASDIRASDTLAWALYHAGRHVEAWEAAEQALRLGTREPKLLYHAGMIALRLPGRRAQGERLLRRALALNPAWHPLDAPAARRVLSGTRLARDL